LDGKWFISHHGWASLTLLALLWTQQCQPQRKPIWLEHCIQHCDFSMLLRLFLRLAWMLCCLRFCEYWRYGCFLRKLRQVDHSKVGIAHYSIFQNIVFSRLFLMYWLPRQSPKQIKVTVNQNSNITMLDFNELRWSIYPIISRIYY